MKSGAPCDKRKKKNNAPSSTSTSNSRGFIAAEMGQEDLMNTAEDVADQVSSTLELPLADVSMLAWRKYFLPLP